MTDERHGLLRVAAASLPVHLACPAANADELVGAARCAAEEGAAVLVTPELGLTGATCGDLFCQQTLLEEALLALVQVARHTAELPLLLVVGLPLRFMGQRFNCAAVLQGGQVQGIVPKTNLSGRGGREEERQFASGNGIAGYAELPGLGKAPFGSKLLFHCNTQPQLTIGVEIGEDLWALSPPSEKHAAAGATLILCLGAQAEGACRAAQRRSLVCGSAGRLAAGYAYAGAGEGESTTDWVYAGHCLLAENGKLLAEALPFAGEMAIADMDFELLQQERCRRNTFDAPTSEDYRELRFALDCSPQPDILRPLSPLPFLPPPEEEAERFETLLTIQAQGLRKRLAHTGAKKAMVGVSGGLDSTLALLVMARAMRLLARPSSDILAVTMPGFGTTLRTKNNAEQLCRALGVELKTVDITASVRAHFKDIGQEETRHDVTYENAQARMRTMVLMDLANQCGGLVVGTGDLSELALGWATYNGDHMSMYGVNAAVPKTLLRALVAHEAGRETYLAEVLGDVLNTPVSPELLPPEKGEISQQTEQIVGPYELHDFFLYYMLRHGFRPGKIYSYAQKAFGSRYQPPEILRWMKVFYSRFFSQQFKRNCLPDSPALGSVGLSPRGSWQMPSDALGRAWLLEVETLLAEQAASYVKIS